jgi:hypothetical protein
MEGLCFGLITLLAPIGSFGPNRASSVRLLTSASTRYWRGDVTDWVIYDLQQQPGCCRWYRMIVLSVVTLWRNWLDHLSHAKLIVVELLLLAIVPFLFQRTNKLSGKQGFFLGIVVNLLWRGSTWCSVELWYLNFFNLMDHCGVLSEYLLCTVWIFFSVTTHVQLKKEKKLWPTCNS